MLRTRTVMVIGMVAVVTEQNVVSAFKLHWISSWSMTAIASSKVLSSL